MDLVRTIDSDRSQVFPGAVRAISLTISREQALRGNRPERMLVLESAGMMTGLPQRAAFSCTMVNLARVAIALERYHLTQTEYPGALEALVPTYLPAVPHEVIGGGSLHYVPAPSETRFTLYSIGWNEVDDGGRSELPEHQDRGDWAWPPYPALKTR